MAISDTQKVDLLWKKVGFSKTKTDTNANKKAPNEAIVSDLIIKPAEVWSDVGSIPSTIPASNTSIIRIYTGEETTEDGTSTNNRTWKTGITNWIPPKFGSTYKLIVSAPSVSAIVTASTYMQIQQVAVIQLLTEHSYLKLDQVMMTNGTLIINQVY